MPIAWTAPSVLLVLGRPVFYFGMSFIISGCKLQSNRENYDTEIFEQAENGIK